MIAYRPRRPELRDWFRILQWWVHRDQAGANEIQDRPTDGYRTAKSSEWTQVNSAWVRGVFPVTLRCSKVRGLVPRKPQRWRADAPRAIMFASAPRQTRPKWRSAFAGPIVNRVANNKRRGRLSGSRLSCAVHGNRNHPIVHRLKGNDPCVT